MNVPIDDKHTVRINIEGKDPMALRFIAGDERLGQVIDVHYGDYVHTLRLSPTGKKASIWTSRRRAGYDNAPA